MPPFQPRITPSDATPLSEFQRGVKDCIPLLLGVIPLALVLGATAAQKDFSLLEVPLLTGLNFAGGSEFAVLEAWTDPPHLLTLIFITFLINSSYILLGASLVPYYAGLCIVLYLAWVGFTTLGALVGPVLGDIHYFGFDMAFPAIMLVLLKGMWKGFTEARPWLISLIFAALTYSYLPGNWYVLIGALAGIAAAFWLIQEDEA